MAGPGIAAFEEGCPAIEVEPAFEFFGVYRVALVAFFGEDGADFFLEELEVLRRGGD